MLNVQNRIKNSKIDKIGLKSSEIGKIRWNRKKSQKTTKEPSDNRFTNPTGHDK
jgi:hypothetical protein